MAFGYGSSSRSNPFRHSGAPKPKREVFPTDEIPHLWATQAQTRARNAQGNLYFDGRTIYSYRQSWPLARIYTRPESAAITATNALVLTNSARYSVTTAQHAHAVERAVSHLTQIAVPVPVPVTSYGGLTTSMHAANLTYLRKEADSELARAERAMTEWRVESSVNRAEELYAAIGTYLSFFRIRRKAPDFPQARADAAHARVRRILNPDPVRDAAKIRARKRRTDKLRAELQAVFDNYCTQVETYNTAVRAARAALPDYPSPEQIAQYWRDTGEWLSGQSVTVDAPYPTLQYLGSYQPARYYGRHGAQRKLQTAGFDLPRVESVHPAYDRPSEILLRVSGEEIQTSWGARVPLAAAPMVWSLVRRAMRQGGWTPSGLGRVMIGHYSVDNISADGTMRAGCHTIKFAELQRMARTLGLADAEETQS